MLLTILAKEMSRNIETNNFMPKFKNIQILFLIVKNVNNSLHILKSVRIPNKLKIYISHFQITFKFIFL